MIVPRDIEGQRRLWRSLCSVFGDVPDPPEPPDPPDPPDPCVQDWAQLKWTDVLLFREGFKDLVQIGSFWGAPGMDPNAFYMFIDRQIKCIQLVRWIEYNKNDDTIEVPGRDGWLVVNRQDVGMFKGALPGEGVCRPGQPAEYFMTMVWSDAYLNVDWHLVSLADPPAFPSMDGAICWKTDEVRDVYLCLWNWGYSKYRPDMDREFRVMMFTEGGYVPGSKRPKVMNL